MFGDDFFVQLAESTNVNTTVKSPPPQDAAHGLYDMSDVNWHATTPDEMKAFVGINMQKVLVEYKDY